MADINQITKMDDTVLATEVKVYSKQRYLTAYSVLKLWKMHQDTEAKFADLQAPPPRILVQYPGDLVLSSPV